MQDQFIEVSFLLSCVAFHCSITTAMASITVLDEANPDHESRCLVSGDDKRLPPNLVWRFALAVQHEKIRISSTQGAGQSAIAVYCPLKECSYVHSMPYIDFQRAFYHHLSDLSDNYIDHLGTFLVRRNKLMIEVHFTSSDQIKKCIDGLETMALSKALTGTFCSFVQSFKELELDVALVIQSNIEPRLRLVTRENAAYAFSIVYTNKPALTLFHVRNPEIYGPVKKAYSQLLTAFPDFLGEVGTIDFSPEESSGLQPGVVLMDGSSGELISAPVYEALGQISLEQLDGMSEKQAHDIGVSDPKLLPSDTSDHVHTKYTVDESDQNVEIGTTGVETSTPMQKLNVKPPAAINEDMIESKEYSVPETYPSTAVVLQDQRKYDESMKLQNRDVIFNKSEKNSGKEEGKVKAAVEISVKVNNGGGRENVSDPSIEGHDITVKYPHIGTATPKDNLISNATHLDEAMTEPEIGLLAEKIPPDRYKFLGIHLGLDENEIERIKYDNKGSSLNYILGILLQANKKENASRRSFVTALLHCSLPVEAMIVDPSLDLLTLENKPAVLPPSSPTECLCLVDGQLHFYDKELAKEHLHRQQSITFWKKLHKELSSAVNEELRHYGVHIHSTTEGSLISHIKLSCYNQAMMLSTDIASGKLTNVVEDQMKALGFTGKLAIRFEIDNVEVTPMRCYEIYLKSLLSIYSRRIKIQQAAFATAGPSLRNIPQPQKQQKHTMITGSTQPMVSMKTDTSTTPADSEGDKAALSKSSFKSEKDLSLTDVIVRGTVEQLQIAISKGADLTQYQNGFLPLHVAAHYGKSEMIKILATHGTAVSAKTTTKEQVTALHLAAYSGHLKSAQTLIDLGADIEAPSANGSTPLRLAAGRGSALVTKFLLEKGANSNTKCNEMKTPLYDAITRGHQGIAKMLLHHGANVTVPAVDGETPIHHAIVVGNAEMLRLLVSANPQALNHTNVIEKEPPLVTACKLQSVPLVKTLMEIKANPNVHGKDHMTPLAVASSLENLEIMEILVKHGAEMTLSFPPYGTPLHIVAIEGKVNATRKLLKLGIHPDILDSESTTPLRRAVEHQRTEIASLLLKQGADIHVDCPGDELPLLHKAAKRNDVRMLMVLIKNGADPYKKGIKGGTALFTAATNNSGDAIDLLCTYPGLVDIANKSKITPLMAAILQRKYDCALRLLKHKPNVSLCNLNGMTVLYICVDFRAPEEVVRGILACDATINSPGPNGNTPIMLACHRGFTELVRAMLESNRNFFKRFPHSSVGLVFTTINAQSSSTLEVILQHGADPDCISPHMPMAPLHMLCRQYGSTEIMLQVLLDHHPNVNMVTEVGAPLHVAVVSGKNTFVSMLLHNNADANVLSGPELASPLITAVERNNVEAVCLLLHHGAKVDHALATDGFTALHKAAASNCFEIAQVLIKSGATIDQPSKLGYSPLHVAISTGSQEVFALLIENNSNMNTQDNTGATPLMRAIHDGKNEVALMLIELGADIHKCGMTGLHALHIGARVGLVDIVSRVLDLGANPNTKEQNGVTPLFLAILLGQLNVAKVLIEKGASVNLGDNHKQTPLHVAAENNSVEAVRLLFKHEADPTVCNLNGKVPADLTKSKNIKKMIATVAKEKALKKMPSLEIEEVAHRLAGTGRAAAIAAELGVSENQWRDIEHNHHDPKQRMLAIVNLWRQKKHTMLTRDEEMMMEIEAVLRKFKV